MDTMPKVTRGADRAGNLKKVMYKEWKMKYAKILSIIGGRPIKIWSCLALIKAKSNKKKERKAKKKVFEGC